MAGRLPTTSFWVGRRAGRPPPRPSAHSRAPEGSSFRGRSRETGARGALEVSRTRVQIPAPAEATAGPRGRPTSHPCGWVSTFCDFMCVMVLQWAPQAVALSSTKRGRSGGAWSQGKGDTAPESTGRRPPACLPTALPLQRLRPADAAGVLGFRPMPGLIASPPGPLATQAGSLHPGGPSLPRGSAAPSSLGLSSLGLSPAASRGSEECCPQARCGHPQRSWRSG